MNDRVEISEPSKQHSSNSLFESAYEYGGTISTVAGVAAAVGTVALLSRFKIRPTQAINDTAIALESTAEASTSLVKPAATVAVAETAGIGSRLESSVPSSFVKSNFVSDGSLPIGSHIESPIARIGGRNIAFSGIDSSADSIAPRHNLGQSSLAASHSETFAAGTQRELSFDKPIDISSRSVTFAAGMQRERSLDKPIDISSRSVTLTPPAEPADKLAAPAILRHSGNSSLLPEVPLFAIPQSYPNAPEFRDVDKRFGNIVPKVFNMNSDKIIRLDAIAGDDFKYSSSGVLLPTNQIATALHALKGADGIQRPIHGIFSWQNSSVPLYVSQSSERLDLALLNLAHTPEEFQRIKPYSFRPEDNPLKKNELVVGLGAPRGGVSASPGIVTGVRELPLPADTGAPFPLTEVHALVASGNSGSALNDRNGRLAGIIVQKWKGGNKEPHDAAYAVPIAELLREFKISRKL